MSLRSHVESTLALHGEFLLVRLGGKVLTNVAYPVSRDGVRIIFSRKTALAIPGQRMAGP